MSKEVPIKIETKLELVDDAGNPVDEDWKAWLAGLLAEEWMDTKDQPVLQPATVWSNSPYAQYVEFGSGPARPGNPTLPHEGEKGSFDDIIRTWIDKKPVSIPPNQREEIIKRIKHTIRTKGINPQPFLRSAVYAELDEISRDPDWFNQPGNTIVSIADRIVKRAMDNLEGNGTSYTGALIQSLHSAPVDGLSFDRNSGEYSGVMEHNPPEITDDIWLNPQIGIQNKKAKYGRH